MNLLLYCEITDRSAIPPFGGSFRAHIDQKKHPSVRAASLTAWSLLARALKELGYEALPEVQFEALGKPYFPATSLYFSISHSSNLAAALVSNAPCAVDIEEHRPGVSDHLRDRCLSDGEKQLDCNFFEFWTKKECISKLDGSGMPARPSQIDTLGETHENCFFSREILDSKGKKYTLTALCINQTQPNIKKMEPESLF